MVLVANGRKLMIEQWLSNDIESKRNDPSVDSLIT